MDKKFTLEDFRKVVGPYAIYGSEFVHDCYNYYIETGGDILDLHNPIKIGLLVYKCHANLPEYKQKKKIE